MFRQLCNKIDSLLWPQRVKAGKVCNTGFWSILAAVAKGVAAAGSKAAALASKGAAAAGKASIAAGKGAMAIGKAGASAAKFTGSKAIGLAKNVGNVIGSKAIGLAKNVGNVAKDVGQGIMGKPTAGVQIGSGNMANVLIKPGTGNLAQNAGSFMNSMGKQVGEMVKNKAEEQTGMEFDFGNKAGSGFEQPNQTPSKGLLQKFQEQMKAKQEFITQERPPQGEFEDITPINAFSEGDVGNIQGAPMGVTSKQPLPLSRLSPADIEYYKRMRMQQGGY